MSLETLIRHRFTVLMIASAAFVQSAFATVLVSYNAGPTTGLASTTGAAFDAATVYSHVTASQISNGGGLLPFQSVSTGLGYAPAQGNVYQANTINFTTARTTGSEPADTDYFTFQITPDAGYQISLDNLSFKAARGGSSTARGYDVRSSIDGYATTLATAHVPDVRPTLSAISIPLGLDFQDLGTQVTFRIYLYSTSAASSLEFDDIVLDGSAAAAVPEPRAALLGGLGILALLRRRRQ